MRKQRAGEKLTQREQRELKKYERQQQEKHGIAYMKEMPKGDYLKGAIVANKVMLEQAARLGLPWEPHDKTVNAWAMLARWHALVAAAPSAFYKAAAIALAKDDPSRKEFFPDAEIDWQEECWKERKWELEDKRLIRRREMLLAGAVDEIHGRMADRDVAFNEALGKQFGPAAQALFAQHKEDQQRDMRTLISNSIIDDDGSGEAKN